MESLNFEEIDSRKTTIKAAYSKTCLWFLKHPDYLTWINRREISRHHGFLWIKGKPGAGKSTIMKFLYLKAKTKDRNSQTLTSSFFFNARGGELEKTVSGMYRSLLLQLFRGFPDLQCVLDDPELVPQAQMSCPSLNVLKDLLRSAVSKLGQRSFTCFIDALDECDEQQVMDMVEYFEDLAEQCTEDGLHLQICFSSRHYPFIDIRLGLCLILEEQMGHTGDLETYINTHLRVRDPSFLAELQTRMLEKAAGVFLWVVLVVEVLNSENRRGRLFLKTRLEEVPSGLSELFKDLLRRDKANMEELLLSILWVLLSKRPLKQGEYYHALWSGLSLEGLADLDPPEANVTDADDCVNRCVISSSKGLAEITKSRHPTVQFIHESVRDFLVKDKGLCELWPELGADWESVGHERLKLCCYSYVELVRSQGHLSGLDVGKVYPFLEYASQFVLYHAEHAGNAVGQEAFLDRFPTPVWIGIVNLFEKFKIRRYTQDATLIYIIAERGHSGLIRTLLRANPDNSDIDRPVDGERYRYPLIAAMAKGDRNSVIALLGLPSPVFDGVDITETLMCNIDAGGTRRTPISWACEHGHLGIAKVLISRTGRKSDNHERVWTPLMLALKNGHTDIVKLLVEDGADIHTIIRQENAISLASANGHAGIVKILLDAGADPHFSGANGSSLLCLAASNAHEEVVRLLLEEGVPVNQENNDGSRPLHLAACRKGSVAVMKELLRHGAEIHAQDESGNTCLMEAVIGATVEEVEFLVKHKADVTTRGPDDASCLHYAMDRAEEPCDIVKVLLDNGADVNARDFSGRTCLHSIGYRARTLPSLDRLLQILKTYKVDVNARDNDGNTPLHVLHRAHHSSATPFLSQPGLDVNAQNLLGETPLHCSTHAGRFDVSAMLIECGADVNSVDNKGRTPLDLRSNDQIAQLLT
jgi:ankyrin repeat protein